MRLTPREILERLVGFPTVSRGSNLELIDWVEAYLASHGVTSHRVWNEDRTKAGLFANVGPEVPGGVILSGHTDVVPVEGQAWTSDPWTVTERDGRLYGRGTADMKGFDALALAMVPLALERGVRRPLQIALSYDEEIGCTGAPPLVAAMEALPRASAAVIGEPTMLKAVTGHKAGRGFSVRVRGVEVHSSMMHKGVNAIMWGAKLIEWANAQNDALWSAEPKPLAALFDPPFTTIHVGEIRGGTAHNITAGSCVFGVDFRVVPGEDPEAWAAALRDEAAALEARMRAVRPEAAVEVTAVFSLPALEPEADGAAEGLVRRLTGDNARHTVSYGTEAGHFQAGGYSSVVCGPGDIAQAHQPDEYITVDQFEAGEAFLARLVDQLCEE